MQKQIDLNYTGPTEQGALRCTDPNMDDDIPRFPEKQIDLNYAGPTDQGVFRGTSPVYDDIIAGLGQQQKKIIRSINKQLGKDNMRR